MVEFLRGRHLEVAHVHALRVHAAHQMADRPVLPARVQRLQAHQHAVGVLCGKPPLVVGQQLDAVLEQLDAVFLLHEVSLVAGVEVLAQVHL
jgi:hypothetical protein